MVCGGWCRSWPGGTTVPTEDEQKSPVSSSSNNNSSNKSAIASPSPTRFSRSSWDEQLPAPDLPYPLACVIVALSSFICFIHSLSGDFVFDDAEAIVNNNDVRQEYPLSNLFRNDFWGMRLTHPSSHKSYRPLTVLSFRFNYMWGGLDPVSYHAVNIILHCVVSVMSLRIFYIVFGSSCPRAAVLSAVLFATHPIHTEAVSGIVGRADLLCALLVFVALLSYVRAAKAVDYIYQDKGRPAHRSSPGWYCLACLLLTGTSTALAMLCKEVGITALGVCSAYDVLLANGGSIGRIIAMALLGEKQRATIIWRNIPDHVVRGIVMRHLILLVMGMVLLLGRWWIMGATVPRFMKVDNPSSFLDNVMFRGINYQYIYSINVLLLFLPLWMCFDWSMGCVPLILSYVDPRILALPCLWLSFVLLIRRGCSVGGQTARCVLMGLALLVVPFLPAMNLFFRVGFVIAERVLYLPSAGFCILVVTGMRELGATGYINKRALQLCYLSLVALFVFRCQQRTQDWLTEKKLFQAGLDVCPLNAKVHYNMGKVEADAGDAVEAVRRYREALRLNNNYDQAMNNLANMLKDQGHLDEALHLLKRAVDIRPDFAAAWMNLGIVQASLGDHHEAQTSYLTALQHRAVYPDCLYNLGNLYLEMGDHKAALGTWTNATSLKPTLAVAWTNMLILLDARGQYESALNVAQQALQHLASEPAIHFNLANTLGKLSRYEESEKHFLRATILDSNNANYWANLGVLYHRWRRYDKAEQSYIHALRLNPSLKSAQENLSMLLKATGKLTR